MYRVQDFSPLVRNRRLANDFSFEHLVPPAPSGRKYPLAAFKLLDAFLRIIGQKWDAKFSSAAPEDLWLFVGALHSPCFVSGTPLARYAWTRALYRFCASALDEPTFTAFSLELDHSSTECTPWCATWAQRFERLPIPDSVLPYIRGWPSTNLAGRTTWFPMAGVARKLGSAFADELHRAADSYYSIRRAQRIPGFVELCAFITQYPGSLTPADLLNPVIAPRFWMAFLRNYFETGVAKDLSVEFLARNWNAEFAPFAETHLFHPKLFLRPAFGVPDAKPKSLSGEIPHARVENGVTSIHKLLVPVPLEASDQEAMEILFRHLSRFSRTIERWAQAEVDELDSKIDRREALAPKGTPRVVGPSHIPNGKKLHFSTQYPERGANTAATFEHHGLGGGTRFNPRLLYPSPLDETAEWLGLPLSGALLPHCALLTIDHPEITPAFLEGFELYDECGRVCGYRRIDGQTVLIGFKRRKGVVHARQEIQLNERSDSTVQSIIRATAPLRNHLRKAGDDNWRMLLLSCGRGFASPQPVRRLATHTSRLIAIEKTAKRIRELVPDCSDISDRVAENFALPPLRATQGVLALINGASTAEMAKKLGHTVYEPKLLARYLPEPLLHFFQDRWIRLFQEGLILHAMSGSPFKLEASSFKTAAEIDAFLLRHCLSPPPEPQCSHQFTNPRREALVQVDDATLSILRSAISYAEVHGENSPGTVRFWSTFGQRLFRAIESSPRDDLKSVLRASERGSSTNNLPWDVT